MNSKNLLKKNRYQGLKQLQRTLDNFFNDIWWPTSGISETWEEFQPRSELREDENNYYVEVELPGVKKEDIEINLEENVLRIHGKREERKSQENVKQHYSEVFYGSFTREFTLPTAVKKEKINAKHENGILFVTIIKNAESKTQRIEIE